LSTTGANVVVSPCREGVGPCAAAENSATRTHTIVTINNSTRGRRISLCIKRLSFKRESDVRQYPALFSNAMRDQTGTHRPLARRSNAKAAQRVGRVGA